MALHKFHGIILLHHVLIFLFIDHNDCHLSSHDHDDENCHGPCSVTFFPKNNQRMAPTESPMMAASPLFSATITTGHLRRTYIRAPSEYSLHSVTTRTTCILIIVITNQHHVLSTAAQPQPHHAPHTFHVPGQSHRARTSLKVMSLGHCYDTLFTFTFTLNT